MKRGVDFKRWSSGDVVGHPGGGCWEACLATLLFVHPRQLEGLSKLCARWNGKKGWYAAVDRWLKAHYAVQVVTFGAPRRVRWRARGEGPRGIAITSVKVDRNDRDSHSILCVDGKIIHDPSGYVRQSYPPYWFYSWQILVPLHPDWTVRERRFHRRYERREGKR